MIYVLDASSAMKTALAETDSDKGRALIADYAAGIHELLAPDIFPVEIAHGLIRAERRGLIIDAPAKIHDVMANAPVLHRYIPLLGRALELASQARIGVCDCLYASLAEQEGCKVVTSDLRLLNGLPHLCVDLATL